MLSVAKIRYIKNFLKKEGLDAFFFTSPANVFYLTGFKSTHAYIIFTPEERFFLTDARYFGKAEEELMCWQVILIEGQSHKFLKKFLKEIGVSIIGFEKDFLTCEFREKLKIRGIKFKGFSGVLKNLRKKKFPEEIVVIKEGIKKTDEVYNKVLEKISPGMSELEVRGLIVSEIFSAGSPGESFPAIVASGKHSAIPHWETSLDTIKAKGPLLIDMGLIWEGYCSDFTRTIYLGKPPKEFLHYYELVKTAWWKGFEKVKIGTPLKEVDLAIREYFWQKGVDKYFIHATGHGVGVEIHEEPRVFKTSEDIIEEGMVFTIEPGLYFKGKFGIRLENIVIVENGKGEVPSQVPLDLKTL